MFIAETFDDTQVIDPELDVAIEVKDAAFTWDSPPPEEAAKKGKHGKKHSAAEVAANAAAAAETAKNEEERIFKLKDLTFSIPRGQLVAVVGAVSCLALSVLVFTILIIFAPLGRFWQDVPPSRHDRRDAEDCGNRQIWGLDRVLPSECLDPGKR